MSEITDDCGLGLSYDSDHCEKVGKRLGAQNFMAGISRLCLMFPWGLGVSLNTLEIL